MHGVSPAEGLLLASYFYFCLVRQLGQYYTEAHKRINDIVKVEFVERRGS